jgi:hypothetical protein
VKTFATYIATAGEKKFRLLAQNWEDLPRSLRNLPAGTAFFGAVRAPGR